MPLQIPDQSIPAQIIQPPDPMQRISGMLNMKAQQIANQSNQANLNEKTAIRNLVNDPTVQNDDGSLNQDKFTAKAQIAAPTLGAGIAQGNLGNQAQQTANQGSQYALHKDYTNTVLQTAAGLMQDPRITADPSSYDPAKANDALTEAFNQARAKGVPDNQALLAVAPLVNAIHTPGAVRQMLANTIQGQMGAPGQAAQNLVPAGAQQTPTADNVGNPAVATRDQFGKVGPMQGQPVQGQSDTPMPTGALPPGAKDQIPQLSQETMVAKNTMLAAPLAHTTNQGILHEIDNVTATGQAGPVFQKLNSLMGGVLKFGNAEEKASSYDMVGKYMERNALNAAASMGPQTNAGLEAQIKANGSLGYNPTAIKAITKLNDAIVTGTEAYYPGLQKAIQANPQQGVLAKNQYDQQWASVFSPTVMQLYNAAKSNDKAEVGRIIQQVGGAKSAGAMDLANRAKGIQSLMQTGQLPQGSQ
jgi:hypothetical protein